VLLLLLEVLLGLLPLVTDVEDESSVVEESEEEQLLSRQKSVS